MEILQKHVAFSEYMNFNILQVIFNEIDAKQNMTTDSYRIDIRVFLHRIMTEKFQFTNCVRYLRHYL